MEKSTFAIIRKHQQRHRNVLHLSLDVRLGILQFTGWIYAIILDGMEYRLATYKGMARYRCLSTWVPGYHFEAAGGLSAALKV